MEFSSSERNICDLNDTASTNVYTIIMIIISAIGTIENITAIHSLILKHQSVRTQPSDVLLFVLAVIDLIIASVVIPLRVHLILVQKEYWCFYVLFHSMVFLSMCTVALLSVHRMCEVLFIDDYVFTSKKLLAGIIVAWIVPFTVLFCTTVQMHREVWFSWLYTVSFYVCVILYIAFPQLLILRIRITLKKIGSYDLSHTQGNKTTMTIIVTSLLLNMPMMVRLSPPSVQVGDSEVLCALCYVTLFGHSLVNPIVHTLLQPNVRQHVVRMIQRRRGRGLEDEEAVNLDEETVNLN